MRFQHIHFTLKRGAHRTTRTIQHCTGIQIAFIRVFVLWYSLIPASKIRSSEPV
jgi:hypothetical protein